MTVEIAIYDSKTPIPSDVLPKYLEDNTTIELQHAQALVKELNYICSQKDLTNDSWKTPQGLQNYRRLTNRTDILLYVDKLYAGYVSYHLGCNQLLTWNGITPAIPKTIHIDEIYIRSAYRHQGHASLLLNRVLEIGRRQGCKQLTLSAMRSNREARALYAGKGFRVIEKQLYGVPSRQVQKPCTVTTIDPVNPRSKTEFWTELRRALNRDAAVFYPLEAVTDDIYSKIESGLKRLQYQVIEFKHKQKWLAYGIISDAIAAQRPIATYTALVVSPQLQLDTELFALMAQRTFNILKFRAGARMMNINLMYDALEPQWNTNGFNTVYEVLAKSI